MVQNRSSWPWSALGLPGPSDPRAVKRAYAARLKQIDRTDPDAFGALRGAYDAARARAERATPKRPRMAEIAGGTAAPDPIPDTAIDLPEPTPAQAPDRGAKTPRKTDSGPGPAPHRGTPAPTRAAPPPQPWGTKPEDLDALMDVDPRAAEDGFRAQLRKATTYWPWNVAALDKLLSLDMAHDIQRRREAENGLYDALQAQVGAPETGYAPSVAELIERQFGWAADGVGLRRRLGYKPDFELIMHRHTLSLPPGDRPGKAADPETDHKWGWYKGGVFLLLWFTSLQGQVLSSLSDGIVHVIAVYLFFWICRWITRGLVTALGWLGRITRLAGPVRARFGQVFPETEKALDRSAKARDFAIFVLAALLAGLTFVAA